MTAALVPFVAPSIIMEGSYHVHSGNSSYTIGGSRKNLTEGSEYLCITDLLTALTALGGPVGISWEWNTAVTPPRVNVSASGTFTLTWTDPLLGLALGFPYALSSASSYTAPLQPAFYFMPTLGAVDYRPRLLQIPRKVAQGDMDQHRVITAGTGDTNEQAVLQLQVTAEELVQFLAFWEYAARGYSFRIYQWADPSMGKFDDGLNALIADTGTWAGYLDVCFTNEARQMSLQPHNPELYDNFDVTIRLWEYVP